MSKKKKAISGAFEYKLSGKIQFHSNGAHEETSTLYLRAPSNRNRHQLNSMKQAFARAMVEARDMLAGTEDNNASGKEDVSQDPEDMGNIIVSTVMMSTKVDLNEFTDEFRTLLLNGVCFLDKGYQNKLTSPMFDDMDPDDTDDLLIRYCGHFLSASLMSS